MKKRHIKKDKGSVLVVSLAVLALITIMALAFSVNMRQEQRISKVSAEQTSARFITKAGLYYAIEALMEDFTDDLKGCSSDVTQPIDSWRQHAGFPSFPYPAYLTGTGGTDLWITRFYGTDTDLNDDTINDSKWFYLHGTSGEVIGRFAVLIQDENGKINLNTAGNNHQFEGFSTYEVDLQAITGIDSTEAQNIEYYRYGDDRQQSYSPPETAKPGQNATDNNNNDNAFTNDGIDNDADGDIDENNEGSDSQAVSSVKIDPTEFNPDYPYYNDTPLCSIEELNQIVAIDDSDIVNARDLATVWSRDRNHYYNGDGSTVSDNLWLKKFNINHIRSSTELYELLDNYYTPENALRYGASIMDYADSDHYITVTGPYSAEPITTGIEGIQFNEIKNGYYYMDLENDGATAHPAPNDIWPSFSNSYSSTDWTLSGNTHKVNSYDNSAGASDVIEEHKFRWAFDASCTYRMAAYTNSSPSEGYDVIFEEGEPGQISTTMPTIAAGTGKTPDVSVLVSADGILNLTIRKTIPAGTISDISHFDFVRVHAGRYVELVNISQRDIEIQANPLSVESHQLVLGGTLQDQGNDLPATVSGPGAMYPLKSYKHASVAPNSVTGNFTLAALSPVPYPYKLSPPNSLPTYSFLLLADSIYAMDNLWGDCSGSWGDGANEGGILLTIPFDLDGGHLKQNMFFCDSASPPQVLAVTPLNFAFNMAGFTGTGDWYDSNSMTRTSPINQTSAWQSVVGTPGRTNTIASNTESGNDKYWRVKDYHFVSPGELGMVFQGTDDSSTLENYEIENLVSRVTTSCLRLEAENASVKGFSGAYTAGPDGTTRYTAGGSVGTWTWTWSFDPDQWWNTPFQLTNGASYHVFAYGDFGGNFEYPAGTDRMIKANNGTYLGELSVSQVGAAGAETYQLSFSMVGNSSDTPILDYIVITPLQDTPGRININTAPLEVLDGLPLTTSTTTVVAGRPYAHIGQLLNNAKAALGEEEFYKVANLVTTRSDHFKIRILGQAIEDIDQDGVEGDATDRIQGQLKMQVIVDRNPSFKDPTNDKKYTIEYLRYEEM